VWATQFPWAEMFKSEIGKIHHVKCMACSFVKGKDVIIGPNVNILEKRGENKGLFETCCTCARNKENGMLTRSATMQIMRLLCFKRVTSQLLNKLGKVKGESTRKQQQFVTILHLL
jgi:hypothetical protein